MLRSAIKTSRARVHAPSHKHTHTYTSHIDCSLQLPHHPHSFFTTLYIRAVCVELYAVPMYTRRGHCSCSFASETRSVARMRKAFIDFLTFFSSFSVSLFDVSYRRFFSSLSLSFLLVYFFFVLFYKTDERPSNFFHVYVRTLRPLGAFIQRKHRMRKKPSEKEFNSFFG